MEISTHAPLARCDVVGVIALFPVAYFNSRTSCEVRHIVFIGANCAFISTHAPLARCDPTACARPSTSSLFQLTHLLRGATYRENPMDTRDLNFNSRTSCEVRLYRHWIQPYIRKFQLTHLLRGATGISTVQTSRAEISTHAPLARCDVLAALAGAVTANFNSRTSCEVRHALTSIWMDTLNFNSRTSCEVRRT